jgi:hypothetical protein
MFMLIVRSGLPALLDRYDEFFDEELEFHPVMVGSVEGGRSFVGRRGFAEFVDEFTSAFAEMQLEDPSFEDVGGGRILVTASMSIRGSSSGVPLQTPSAFLFEVHGDKVARARSFFSRADAEDFARA